MKNRLPAYTRHKATGQARVCIKGKDFYLGPYGSVESRLKYAEILKKLAVGLPVGSPIVDPFAKRGSADPGPTINELAVAFLKHCDSFYRKAGKRTAEYDCCKGAIRPLTRLFGSTPANTFGPAALKATRQKMLDSGKMCREYCNKSVGRIRRMFKWGVENELVSATVLAGLNAVQPLRQGHLDAFDHPSRGRIDQTTLDAVRAAVTDQTRDMIDLAILTGCRPGELVSLTASMIDKRDPTAWVAVLDDHKTKHMGKVRALAFGPKSQEILKRHLPNDPQERLFPMLRETFSNRLKLACDNLGLPRFTGHWLRHTAATEIRQTHGLDGVQASLGHSSASMSDHYAHLSIETAKAVARDRG